MEREAYPILIKFVDDLVLDAGPDKCRDAHGEISPLATASPV